MALQPGCSGLAMAWHGSCQARQQCCARSIAARTAALHVQRGCRTCSLEHKQSLVDREVVGLEALNQLKGHLANFSKVGTLGDLHVNR